jgi:lichenan operon transcriptional antiterminator
MNRNELQVIDILCRQADWTTAAFLSSHIQCSIRSIKNYIASIHSQYPGLIISSRSGYMITDKAQALHLLEHQEKSSNLPQDARERKSWLLCKLLLNGDRLKLDFLSSQLCISYYTLLSLLDSLKSILSNYDLTLKTKNDCVWVSGADKNKKNLLIDMVYEEIPDFYGDSSLLQTYFPHFSIASIRQILDTELKDSQYYIDDFSKLYLALYICITLEQHQSNNCPDSSTDGAVIADSAVQQMVDRLINAIYDYSHIRLNDMDCHDISVILSSRTWSEDQSSPVHASTMQLVEEIQKRIRHLFNTSLSDIQFLCLHLESLQLRLKNQLTLKNPQLTSIKESYPYIYEIAVAIAEVIERETKYSVPEDEIAYLAMYIGIMIDYQKNMEFKVKVVLFCPQYYSIGTSLADKINQIFEDKIILTTVITDSGDLVQAKDYDLIISTVPLRFHRGNCKYISTHIKSEEIVEINTEIDRLYHNKMRQHYYDRLSSLFHENLFFYDPVFENREEAIQFLSNKLIEQGIVDSSFTDKVFEREKISSSAFSNIALPHPIDMCAKSSAIATIILPNGMTWGKNTVNLIFMLAICDEDTVLFKDTFSFITDFINNPQNVRHLMNCRTYEAFMDTLLSFFSNPTL